MAKLYRFPRSKATPRATTTPKAHIPIWDQYSPACAVILPEDFFCSTTSDVPKQGGGCKLGFEGFYFRLIACKKPLESIRAFCKRAGYSKSAFYNLKKDPAVVAMNRCSGYLDIKICENLGIHPGWLVMGFLEYAPLRELGKWPRIELIKSSALPTTAGVEGRRSHE